MGQPNTFRKHTPQVASRLTIREAVKLYADLWWVYMSAPHARSALASQPFDHQDALNMNLYEKGIIGRVSTYDIAGADLDSRERIFVSFDYPPIPDRSCDYSAVREGYDGAPDSRCPVGRGATPFFAINDLIEQESE